MNPEGFLIAIESSNDRIKNMQFKLLAERLRNMGFEVAIFDFPRINEPSSYFIQNYNKGVYGEAETVSPYTASLFFALDHYESLKSINYALDKGLVVLCNRYSGSNMAYQGSKFGKEEEQRGFFIWLDNLEHSMLAIPRPNLSIVLTPDLDGASANQGYPEIDKTFSLLCDLFPKDYKQVKFSSGNEKLSLATVHNQIWHLLLPHIERATQTKKQAIKKPKKSNPVQIKQTTPTSLPKASLLLCSNLLGEKGLEIIVSPPDFYTPAKLSEKAKLKYKKNMKQLFKLRADIDQKLSTYIKSAAKSDIFDRLQADEALRNLIPLATLCSVNVSSELNLAGLSKKLAPLKLPEIIAISKLLGIKYTADSNFENIKARQSIHSQNTPVKTLKLEYVSHRNELDIIQPGSNDTLPYPKKVELLMNVIARIDSTSELENVIYRWQIIMNYSEYIYLQQIGFSNKNKNFWLTNTIGFDRPKIVDLALASEEYEKCLELSESNRSLVESSNSTRIETSYTALLGHKQHINLEISAASLTAKPFKIALASPDAPKILQHILKTVGEVHPIIASTLY